MQLYIHKRSEEDVNANVSYNYVPRGNAEDVEMLFFFFVFLNQIYLDTQSNRSHSVALCFHL